MRRWLRSDALQKGKGVAILMLGRAGSSSVVECFLAKEDVAGSTPVSRSNNLNLNHLRLEDFLLYERFVCSGVWFSCPGRGTQVVRERSAKPLCVGSIPTRASNFNSVQPNKHAHSLRLWSCREDLSLPLSYRPSKLSIGTAYEVSVAWRPLAVVYRERWAVTTPDRR